MCGKVVLKELCDQKGWRSPVYDTATIQPPWKVTAHVSTDNGEFTATAMNANKRVAQNRAAAALVARVDPERHARIALTESINYVGQLLERLQAIPDASVPSVKYQRQGQDHMPSYTATMYVKLSGKEMIATGQPAATKKAADQSAAREMLLLLPSATGRLSKSSQFKSTLQETAQAAGFQLPSYEIVSQSGTGAGLMFTARVEVRHCSQETRHATGSGSSKRRAEDMAAQQLLQQEDFSPLLDTKLAPDQDNPVAKMNNLAAQAAWRVDVICHQLHAAPHPPYFQATVLINGQPVAIEHGASPGMASARQAAAQAALRCFAGPRIEGSRQQLGSKMERLSLQCLQQLKSGESLPGGATSDTVLSCVILERNSRTSLVSLGTGTSYYTGGDLETSMGGILTDCHAEVIARRGLLRFLYQQAHAALTGASNIVFERPSTQASDQTGLLRLAPGVKFHLYISAPPCGDAKYSSRGGAVSRETWPQLQHPSRGGSGERLPCDHHAQGHWPRKCHLIDPAKARAGYGVLRAKTDYGESESPLPRIDNEESSEISSRLVKMTCSDKIAKWNALGLQGALLSQLIEPVYLSSITCGSGFSHGALSRAACCRLDVEGNAANGLKLQAPFRVNHPVLLHGAEEGSGLPRPAGHGRRSSSISLNWNVADKSLEVVDGSTGMLQPGGRPSRLSKRQLYAKFTSCRKQSGASYRLAKDSGMAYAAARQSLYSYFCNSAHSQQQWLRRSCTCPTMERFS